MSDAERPISLDEYVKLSGTDSNLWWELGSGHHLNLLDEALERLEAQQAEIERLRTELTECRKLLREAADRLDYPEIADRWGGWVIAAQAAGGKDE